MPTRKELEPEARRLRAEGKTFEAIGELIGKNEKTVRVWSHDWPKEEESTEQEKFDDRSWPDWNEDD